MTLDAWVTVAVVVAVLALLVRERVAPAVVVFGADVVLLVTGVVDAGEALSGFANPAPFTVAALYVVARAVEKTGSLQPVLAAALGDGRRPRRSLARLLSPVAAASGFLNNTPVVATSMPQVSRWARDVGTSASRFLMPLSFAAILGGLVTVIGTSTTLVVSGLLEARGLEPLGLFEITPLGLPIAVLGLAYLVLASPKLLPERRVAFEEIEERQREFIVHMEVRPGGPLDGTTVEEGGLRHLQSVFLTEVLRRDGEVVAPARPDTHLHGGDVLVFAGRADRVLDLQHRTGLVSAEREHVSLFQEAGHTYFEAVLGTNSPLVGRTLRDADFRRHYQGAVLGIHRSGEAVRAKLGTVELRAGDTLLVLADEEFRDLWRDRPDFLVIARRGGAPPTSTRQSWLVGAVLLGIVGLAASGVMPILHASLAGAFLLIGTRVLTVGEARRAVDLDVVVLIASAFGLAAAVEGSGLADVVADGVLGLARDFGPRGMVLALVGLTLVLTEIVTNNAAAVLVFPVALSAAASAGFDARVAALVVAVAASASFLTPIGYQTNTMVYGAGGYRFGDFARLGLPLTVLVVLVVVVWAPVLAA